MPIKQNTVSYTHLDVYKRQDTELTGTFVHDTTKPDLDGVRHAINDAREEALIRQQGREAAAEMD